MAATAGLDKGEGYFSSVLGAPNGKLRPGDGGLLMPNESGFLLYRPGKVSVAPNGVLKSNFREGYHRGAFSLTSRKPRLFCCCLWQRVFL